MTQITQLAGGTSETEDFYIGPEREIRIDTSNDEIRIHDGSTPGGKRVPNKDTNDTLYQSRSDELDGFDFSAQGKGFLARVGPANYKLRTLTVNEEQLTLTNPKGTLGDPVFGLAATITTDHSWTGLHTFTQPITGEAGFVGDVTGDVTGNLTGNVTGNVTGNLDGDSTGTHTGSVDVRGAEILLDDEQIDVSKIGGLSDFVQGQISIGFILLWSGLVDDIPVKWALCDGNNGTPDLTDKFIIGAGDTYAVGAFGGAANHDHDASSSSAGAHTHTADSGEHTLTVDEIPGHKHLTVNYHEAGGPVIVYTDTQETVGGIKSYHNTGGNNSYNLRGIGGVEPDRGGTSQTGGGQPHSHSGGTTSENGTHGHSITVDVASSLPPYYALAYIMKVA